jgi:hypothetical protein
MRRKKGSVRENSKSEMNRERGTIVHGDCDTLKRAIKEERLKKMESGREIDGERGTWVTRKETQRGGEGGRDRAWTNCS